MEGVAAEIVLYPETDELVPLVREKAIGECINVWKKSQEVKDLPPLWGDEIEYTLLELDESTRTAKLCLKGDEVFGQLQTSAEAGAYTQELGAFQIESKPAEPFDSSAKSLLSVEQDMAARRATIASRLGPTRFPFTITTFPLLGNPASVAASHTTSAALVALPARYRAVQHHITVRRAAAAAIPPIAAPLYADARTLADPAALPPFIDAQQRAIAFAPDEMLLGGTQSCLQCTIQCADSAAARALHDALAPLGPLMLALAAATPAYRGWLADSDVRWNVLRQLVDDRDGAERAAQGRWGRGRYGVAEVYLTGSEEGRGLALEGLVEDESVVGKLVAGGLEEGVARYYAGALARPLFVYPRAFVGQLEGGKGSEEKEQEEKEKEAPKVPPNVNFEFMHRCFFPHVKLKHPTADGEGWRVEFRPMDVQLSDFENAAYVVFVVLVARATRRFGVDWRVPLARVWENFERAHPRDAVRWQRFWWRVDDDGVIDGAEEKHKGGVALLTADEIVNGCPSFKGIMSLVADYMEEEGFAAEEQEQLRPYLDLVSGRASGKLCTAARFIRDFVVQHPEYAKDSQVSEGICFNLLQEIRKIVDGKRDSRLFC